jgi:adenosylcobinamide-GDP ribazoletransferase
VAEGKGQFLKVMAGLTRPYRACRHCAIGLVATGEDAYRLRMSFAFDLYRTARFATRLPLPVLARENDDPVVPADRFAPPFVVCGLIIGAAGGLVAGLLALLGASGLISAFAAVAAMILLTGALHEDGLADCADGFGGGRTRERKLEIMRDPAIGSYGVLALILSVGVRVAALAALADLGPWLPLLALLATQPLSRALAMALAHRLPHARPEGASARLGRPSARAAGLSIAMGFVCAGIALLLALPPGAALLSLVALLAASAAAAWLVYLAAERQIDGQTGDVLGAAQQLSDLAGLITVSISVAAVL